MEMKAEAPCCVRIPLSINVRCAGIHFGRTTGIIMDSETCQLTHLMIREKGMLGIERMTSIDLAAEIAPGYIDLHCTGVDLAKLEAYGQEHDGLYGFPDPLHTYGDYLVWSSEMLAGPPFGMLAHESVPPRSVILRKGARVMATNGLVGRVNGLLADSGDWQITHVTLRQHHLWGDKVFAIPVSDIAHIEEDSIYLQLARADIKGLRTAPSS